MTVQSLDHVAIRSARWQALRDWYVEVLGLEDGPRPDFPFPGAWLYANGRAVVHLIGVEVQPDAPEAALRLEHCAFRGRGLADFLARLDRLGIARQVVRLPPGAGGAVLVNLHDPDGNHVHVDFDPDEAGQAAPAG
ncbi:MAG: glyoxalase [Alphaproteobacteria bacterium]|nr:MAG: glyoxalase [Alphaproteobacteria bacterium]